MTTTLHSVLVPRGPAVPRGAQIVGLICDWVAQAAERRAQRRLTEETESVRRFAHRIQPTDPGMAADLLAAADRHAA